MHNYKSEDEGNSMSFLFFLPVSFTDPTNRHTHTHTHATQRHCLSKDTQTQLKETIWGMQSDSTKHKLQQYIYGQDMSRWEIWSFFFCLKNISLLSKLLVPMFAVQIIIIIVPGCVEVGSNNGSHNYNLYI